MKQCLIGLPGRKELVNLYNLPPEVIEIKSILSSLESYPRFNARGTRNVSVLRHSAFTSGILRLLGYSEDVQLGGFCHDFSESFIGDLVNPVKQFCPEYKELETSVMSQIEAVYWCGLTKHMAVKSADTVALKYEAAFCGFYPETWDLPDTSNFIGNADLDEAWRMAGINNSVNTLPILESLGLERIVSLGDETKTTKTQSKEGVYEVNP